MRIYILLLLTFVSISSLYSQELNCLVSINHQQIGGSNKQVFTTLEKSLSEYINQTKWTNREIKPEERINCAMTIIITSRNQNTFAGTIQVQSTRPIYNSTYASPILNIKDNNFGFTYNEFDPLIYNRNSFDSNLISTITFYIYVILGVDADTFKKYGGEEALKEAQNVMLQAQQSGLASWSNQVGKQNRFALIDNMLSSKLKIYRDVLYDYHRNGLDNFFSDKKVAKQKLENSVLSMESLHNKTVGNYLIRLFFDAKSDELVNVYSDNPKTTSAQRLAKVLRKISANNNSKWSKIN